MWHDGDPFGAGHLTSAKVATRKVGAIKGNKGESGSVAMDYLPGKETGLRTLAPGHKYYVHCGHKSPKTFGSRKTSQQNKTKARKKKRQNERAEPGNKFNLCKLNWQIIGPEAGSQGRKS